MIKYYLFIAALFLLSPSCTRHNERNRSGTYGADTPYHVDVFRTGSGWGYTVRINNKPYIRQSILPSVEGSIPIRSKAMAIKLGNAVLAKMSHQESPAITRKELEVLGIIPSSKSIAP